MTVNPTPIFTWESYKGNVSLYQENQEYHLTFKDVNNRETPIPSENVRGIVFEEVSFDVNQFCHHYFFNIVKTDKEPIINFFEAEDLNTFEESTISKATSLKFNSLEKKKQKQISTKGPSYRTIRPGLNFHATCANKGCEKDVVASVGLGIFSIGKIIHDVHCPACDAEISYTKITNFGFFDCNIVIEGMQTKPEKKFVNLKDQTTKNLYLTYDEGNTCTWSYLDVTTTKENRRWGCSIL